MGQYRDNTYTIADEDNWKVGMCPKGYSFVIKRQDNSDVCSLFNGLTPMDKALARLLSAAPELLAAAEFAVDALLRGRTANAKADAYRKLVDAIAKAKGEDLA